MTPTLYHFTCDHGRNALGDVGTLLPAATLAAMPAAWWPGEYVWMTNLDVAAREPLGLTNALVTCDRTAHRYRVVDTSLCVWWMELRPVIDNPGLLELAPGARPVHWWVSPVPVPVVYDPGP